MDFRSDSFYDFWRFLLLRTLMIFKNKITMFHFRFFLNVGSIVMRRNSIAGPIIMKCMHDGKVIRTNLFPTGATPVVVEFNH